MLIDIDVYLLCHKLPNAVLVFANTASHRSASYHALLLVRDLFLFLPTYGCTILQCASVRVIKLFSLNTFLPGLGSRL